MKLVLKPQRVPSDVLEGQRKERSMEVRVHGEGFLKELGLRLEGRGFVPVVKRVESLM